MKTKSRTRSSGDARRGRRKWPPEVRLQTAQAIVDRGVSKTAVSQTLGIPVTTVAEWARRYRKYGTDIRTVGGGREAGPTGPRGTAADADPRRAAVIESRREHPEHGTRRIRDVLARFEGLGVSETTVRRILHEEGLLESVRRRWPSRVQLEHRFERAEPNQLWQSDIFTFLLRRHQRLYVTAFMDDYSRYVVSLVMAHHQRSLAGDGGALAGHRGVRRAARGPDRPGPAVHGVARPDRLRGGAAAAGHPHIKSRPHHPQTLGKIERFWKTLWDEFLSRTVFADFEDCQRRIGLFVQAYNFRRPHQGIAGRGARGPLLPGGAAGAGGDREGRGGRTRWPWPRSSRGGSPSTWWAASGRGTSSIALSGTGLMVRLGDVEETIPLRGEESDEERRGAGAGRGKHRSRPTPKWLLTSEDLDQIAQQRCLMVLSVLSGETPVTEAIAQAGISRATYYQLETRALSAMLRALGPLAERGGDGERARCGRSRPWRRR